MQFQEVTICRVIVIALQYEETTLYGIIETKLLIVEG